MHVASLERRKELYELSGWDDCYFTHQLRPTRLDFGEPDKHGIQPSVGSEHRWVTDKRDTNTDGRWFPKEQVSAYDLGYLLRKLQDAGVSPVIDLSIQDRWWAKRGYINKQNALISPAAEYGVADTPEDAAALLCIELFQQGILK